MATQQQQQKQQQSPMPGQLMDEATQRVLDRMLRQTVSWKTPDATEAIELSIDSVRKLFANPTKSGKLPSDRECWLFLQMCKARGLNPYLGDAFLVGYDEGGGAKFNLITAHQALLKRAEASGKKKGVESGVILIDKKTGDLVETVGDFYLEDRHTLVGAWCKVYRTDYELPVYERVKFATYDKGYSRWKADPSGMIVKVAEASAHRLAFPAEVGGLYVREEIDAASLSDEAPQKNGSAPKTISELTDRLTGGTHTDDASQGEPEPQEPQYPTKAHVSPPRESAKPRKKAPQNSDADPAPDEAAEFEAANPVNPQGATLLDNTPEYE